MTKALHDYSIAEAGTLLRSGKVTSVALAEHALDRIKQIDPLISSFITLTADNALREAAAADADFAKGVDKGLCELVRRLRLHLLDRHFELVRRLRLHLLDGHFEPAHGHGEFGAQLIFIGLNLRHRQRGQSFQPTSNLRLRMPLLRAIFGNSRVMSSSGFSA